MAGGGEVKDLCLPSPCIAVEPTAADPASRSESLTTSRCLTVTKIRAGQGALPCGEPQLWLSGGRVLGSVRVVSDAAGRPKGARAGKFPWGGELNRQLPAPHEGRRGPPSPPSDKTPRRSAQPVIGGCHAGKWAETDGHFAPYKISHPHWKAGIISSG